MSTTARPAPAVKAKQRPGDRWFSGTALFAGSMILVTLAAVAIFLIVQSIPGLTATSETASLLTTQLLGLRLARWPSAPSGRRSWRC